MIILHTPHLPITILSHLHTKTKNIPNKSKKNPPIPYHNYATLLWILSSKNEISLWYTTRMFYQKKILPILYTVKQHHHNTTPTCHLYSHIYQHYTRYNWYILYHTSLYNTFIPVETYHTTWLITPENPLITHTTIPILHHACTQWYTSHTYYVSYITQRNLHHTYSRNLKIHPMRVTLIGFTPQPPKNTQITLSLSTHHSNQTPSTPPHCTYNTEHCDIPHSNAYREP